MKANDIQSSFFFTCQRGLESELKNEIIQNTDREIEVTEAFCGVKCKLSLVEAFQVTLNSTLINRSYLFIKNFTFTKNSEIPSQIESINWTHYFNHSKKINIKTSLGEVNSKFADQFKSPFYLSHLTKDGMNNYFQKKAKKKVIIENKNPDLKIYQFIEGITKTKFSFSIYIDFIGFNLGDRGYRLPKQKAPIRETVASYLVRKMNLDPQIIFLDAMSGSGTMVLEYLIHKYQLGGQYLKILNEQNDYDFEKFAFYKRDQQLPKQVKEIITQKKKHIFKQLNQITKDHQVWANDIDKEAIRNILKSLQASRLSPNLETSKIDVLKIKPLKEASIQAFYNPPYGKRIGEFEDLGELYFQIGENHKNNIPNSTFYIIAPEKDLIKKIRLKPFLKDRVFHGGLECFFYGYKIN